MGRCLPVPSVYYRHRMRTNGPDSTSIDRYQRTGPEHNHCLACDTSEPRGSSGQIGVGPRWWSRTRCYREGEAFASRNSPFDVFLTLIFDHRTKFLWPTWSAATQGRLYVSAFYLDWFPSHVGGLEFESFQRPRWLPVPVETKCYRAGLCGESPSIMAVEGTPP